MRRIIIAIKGFLYRLFYRPEANFKRRHKYDDIHYNTYMFNDWRK